MSGWLSPLPRLHCTKTNYHACGGRHRTSSRALLFGPAGSCWIYRRMRAITVGDRAGCSLTGARNLAVMTGSESRWKPTRNLVLQRARLVLQDHHRRMSSSRRADDLLRTGPIFIWAGAVRRARTPQR